MAFQLLFSQLAVKGAITMAISVATESGQGLEWRAILDRVGGDQELVLELIDLFNSDVPESLRTLQEAIAAQDPNRTHHLSHRLKGAVASFLHEPSVRIAQEIEDRAHRNDWPSLGHLYSELVLAVQTLTDELGKCPFRQLEANPAQQVFYRA